MANELLPHHAMAVFDETAGKMLEYRHLINHAWGPRGQKEMATIQCKWIQQNNWKTRLKED
jgi:hypothetical protein